MFTTASLIALTFLFAGISFFTYSTIYFFLASVTGIFPGFLLAYRNRKRFLFGYSGVFAAYLLVYSFLPFTQLFLVHSLLIFISLFLAIVLSRGRRRNVRLTQKQVEAVRSRLEVLNKKYEARMQSLHHLEGQVSSLTNLFEMAGELSDCMDFETLAEHLSFKLRNELAFDVITIAVLSRQSDDVAEASMVSVYEIRDQNYTTKTRPISTAEATLFDQLSKQKSMIEFDGVWSFPIIENERLDAVFTVKGASADDLAKVEVLSAYLVLLIRKIGFYETVKELSIVDELTQFFVRRHFLERMTEELKRSQKNGLAISLLMLDIDHFKRYNDDFGHLVGDATLKEVAKLLRNSLRRLDLVGRYGGEEFIVVMPETAIEQAYEVAERIRANIAHHDFKLYNVRTRVTVSQGLTQHVFQQSNEALDDRELDKIVEQMIRQADSALYQAKDDGRNRVCLYKG